MSTGEDKYGNRSSSRTFGTTYHSSYSSSRGSRRSISASASGRKQQQGQPDQPSEREIAEAELAATGAVVEVDVIEGENGEPGSSVMGTVAGTAAGAALAGGLAAAAALSAPLAAAAAAVGAVVGAVAGGAMGKEVPRGVDVDSAMEFDTPRVVQAGMEADEQEALAETVWDSETAPPPASPGGSGGGGGAAVEESHGRPTLGEHEIGDIKSERQP
ncbi:hypothetical protein PLESTB_001746400 [Pleodorina starrii]|uniref:Uncharacterized protein n=1 Tax=Pleodorina starrii TaxID=330485 RepID=A0A9W6FA64_9CHLO|nr:hypothetical protein PLESTB_001746400 [Pleodorina starrii]